MCVLVFARVTLNEDAIQDLAKQTAVTDPKLKKAQPKIIQRFSVNDSFRGSPFREIRDNRRVSQPCRCGYSF